MGTVAPGVVGRDRASAATLIGIDAVRIVLGCPVPGRGPRLFRRRDPWRRFNTRRGASSCRVPAIDVRAPSSLPGAGVPNLRSRRTMSIHRRVAGRPPSAMARPLCRGHNRRKGAWKPPWWYVLSLEHRRRSYFPPVADVRVTGAISAAELAAHATPGARKSIP